MAPFAPKVSGEGGSARERGLGRGDVVELYGPSGCGKSEVLINVVVQCILPAWLGGEERTAFFFDNGEDMWLRSVQREDVNF